MSAIAKSQWVAFIEPQTEIHAARNTLHQSPTGIYQKQAPAGQFHQELPGKKVEIGIRKLLNSGPSYNRGSANTLVLIQQNAPWNLSRICRRNTTSPFSDYLFDSYGCADVDVYVLDSGIYSQHPQFQGRVDFGANFSSEPSNDDLSGHGTHVAGIIGAQIYGVCKSIQIKSVKILNEKESGTSLSLLLALHWVVKNRDPERKNIIK